MDRLGVALIRYFLSREANYTENHQVRNNAVAIVDIGCSYRSHSPLKAPSEVTLHDPESPPK